MTPEQISNFVLGFLMKRGKPTEDGSVSATLTTERQAGSNFTLLWSPGRPHDVIDHDHLVFDAEFIDSEFDTNNGPYGRYRVSAFERGTWLDVVASALLFQLREEGDATRH
jgi:hypothetical protein